MLEPPIGCMHVIWKTSTKGFWRYHHDKHPQFDVDNVLAPSVGQKEVKGHNLKRNIFFCSCDVEEIYCSSKECRRLGQMEIDRKLSALWDWNISIFTVRQERCDLSTYSSIFTVRQERCDLSTYSLTPKLIYTVYKYKNN